MFNFTIFTKALTDTTLSKNEFRVLCLFLNTSSFKQSNTFEMYNGYIQDTLGISERNVRDITKSLELKDYIKKGVNTNSHNRNANTYTIIDAEKCAENCAENCPPKTRTLEEDKNVPLKTNENIEKNENKPLNDAINCAVFKENTIIDTEKCAEKCAENCPPNNLDIKTKENKNNNITTGILEHKDLEPEVTKENKKYKIKNIKEKNNKKEKLPDQSSMDVKVSEPENKNLSLKKMKENEVSDTGTNVMNAISEQSERQAKENESSGCDKINEMTTSMATPNNINDTGTILQDTQVTNNESLSQPQVKNILPPATATFEEDIDPRIPNIIKNIDFAMNAMYHARYNIVEWTSQYEYFTLQLENLKTLMGNDKFKLYKKQYISQWWSNTKQYFPDGYEKCTKKPRQWELDKFKKFYDWMEHAQEEREVASAYNNICVFLEHLNAKYGEKALDSLTNQIIHTISLIKHRNNHVSNYIEKIQAS